MSMILEKLYEILRNIPKEAIVLIDSDQGYAEVNTVFVEYHVDGRVHVVLSERE